MRFEVFLTRDAERDLEEIYRYIATEDSPTRAVHVLDKNEGVIKNLSKFPARGSFPKELIALGVRDYRQVFFKPYRMIYRVINKRVYIYLIADGRQDMQTLLARCLFAVEYEKGRR